MATIGRKVQCQSVRLLLNLAIWRRLLELGDSGFAETTGRKRLKVFNLLEVDQAVTL